MDLSDMISRNEQTIALYDQDPYQTEFLATVISCEMLKGESGTDADEIRFQIILDQTQFFPEQGGQSADLGVLVPMGLNFFEGQAGAENLCIAVLDVQMRSGVIVHICDGPLDPGTTVAGKVDWNKRFDFMQQHTGEHIFSGLAASRFGCTNVGFHLSRNTVTMDYDRQLTAEQIAALVRKANQVITKDLAVHAWFPTEEEQAHLTWRSKKEIDGDLRLVEIPGVDLCACCAPHVQRTGEIGLLIMLSHEHYKGGTRCTIACGSRAMTAVLASQQLVADSGELLQASNDQILLRIRKLQEERTAAKTALQNTKEELLLLQAARIPAGEPVLLSDPDVDPGVMRRVLNKLVEDRDGICGVFVPEAEDGAEKKQGNEVAEGAVRFRFTMASRDVDLREIAKLLREKASAKCGGSATMIQGSLAIPGGDLKKLEALMRESS